MLSAFNTSWTKQSVIGKKKDVVEYSLVDIERHNIDSLRPYSFLSQTKELERIGRG